MKSRSMRRTKLTPPLLDNNNMPQDLQYLLKTARPLLYLRGLWLCIVPILDILVLLVLMALQVLFLLVRHSGKYSKLQHAKHPRKYRLWKYTPSTTDLYLLCIKLAQRSRLASRLDHCCFIRSPILLLSVSSQGCYLYADLIYERRNAYAFLPTSNFLLWNMEILVHKPHSTTNAQLGHLYFPHTYILSLY